ncbi:MAG TPA: Gfo/Idh/MocA family oxidoreductase [Pyrinomonadaceae bacterium]|nr:Gfo/Idh/MocA family oxidoreductase [Pyrinomonadaceae bacterium]
MSRENSIGIGVIGSGFARRTQIPAFRATAGARVVAIASARRERAEAVAREFAIPFVGDDWREVCERADVHLVSIVTPPATHLEMTLYALARGKAVLCEKPMALSAAETAEMCRAANASGALALIDHELRFLDGRRRLRELLRAGEIGSVRHVGVTYRADSRANAERAWDWWSDARMGGGALGAIGSHVVDNLHWLLGAQVARVFCQLSTHIAARPALDADGGGDVLRPVTTDDAANLLFNFAGVGNDLMAAGASANASLSFVEAGAPLHRVEIFGERGALRVEGDGELWQAELGAGAWRRVDAGRGELAPGMQDNGWSRGFTRFAQEIVGALLEGRNTVEDAATFTDGHRTQLVLDAARRSHRSGSWATVDEESFDGARWDDLA